MKFPYRRYEIFYKPVVPVVFKFEDKTIPYQALIDTGSDVSIIHAEIAYYLDDQDRLTAAIELKKEKEKGSELKNEQIAKKKYSCQQCGRLINHRGNCLPCNVIAKYKREGKKIPEFWQKFSRSQKKS
jgi:hypothetical protein